MQRSRCELWIERLVQAVPRLMPLYTEHRADYDEVLPHVFVGDVARYVAQEFAGIESDELRGKQQGDAVEVLRILDEALTTGDPDLMELVSVSFLENIEWERPEGQSIRSALGPRLREELSRRESQ